MKKWTIEDSKELYNICGWGTSYFGINDKGDVYGKVIINHQRVTAGITEIFTDGSPCKRRVIL